MAGASTEITPSGGNRLPSSSPCFRPVRPSSSAYAERQLRQVVHAALAVAALGFCDRRHRGAARPNLRCCRRTGGVAAGGVEDIY